MPISLNHKGFITLAAIVALAISMPASAEPASSWLGKSLPDITLPDFNGEAHSLEQYRDGKGTVLIFVSTRCPVSNDYNERMVKLAAEYQAKGFQFLGINSNKAEQPTELASHAEENDWNFPVLKDKGNVIADKLGASVTPEVYLLDSSGVLRYHGRIDDSRDPSGIQQSDLKDALDSILANKEIAKKESKAFGCSIKRVEGSQG